MATEVDQFVELISQSGLISPQEVEGILAELAQSGRSVDSKMLADELVRQEKLTDYQSSLLLKGQTQGLLYGDYLVMERLGSGGMATVYKAEHIRSGQIVALKVLSEEASMSPETSLRFDREVQAAAKVSHPNIVTAYDCNLEGNQSYLVMEYVDGITLAQYVEKHGPLPLNEALDYILQAAQGLAHAHEKRIVHRDIKPENLLVSSDGMVKILDLGLARFDNAPKLGEKSDSAHRLTQAGVVLGTADFMAPEQSIDPRRADYRADIYALGCTLYFLLEAKGPFSRDTAMATMMAHQTDPIPKFSVKVPPQLEATFKKMLAKTPKQRHESMHDVIEELEICLGTRKQAKEKKKKSANDAPDQLLGPSPDTATPPKSRSWMFVGAGLGAVVGLVAWLMNWGLVNSTLDMLNAFTPTAKDYPVVFTMLAGAVAGGGVGFLIDEFSK